MTSASSPAPPAGVAVDIRDATIVRSGRALLDEASLRVREGEYWALLGPNGAGKSTLLALCGARIHPSRGEAWILGERLGRVELARLHRLIGHVDPRHDIRSSMPVRTVVATGVTGTIERRLRWDPTPEEEARVDALLDALGLAAKADYRWPHLSQGERGRALVARALAARPRLLLLDEPTTGLDLAAREQLLDTLTGLDTLLGPAAATIHVTHALEELPEATSHVALVSAGRVVAAGPIDATLTSANISAAFDHPIEVRRDGRRWHARGVGRG